MRPVEWRSELETRTGIAEPLPGMNPEASSRAGNSVLLVDADEVVPSSRSAELRQRAVQSRVPLRNGLACSQGRFRGGQVVLPCCRTRPWSGPGLFCPGGGKVPRRACGASPDGGIDVPLMSRLWAWGVDVSGDASGEGTAAPIGRMSGREGRSEPYIPGRPVLRNEVLLQHLRGGNALGSEHFDLEKVGIVVHSLSRPVLPPTLRFASVVT